MSLDTFLSLVLNVLVGLLGYLLGYRQAKTAARQLDLDMLKAAPKVGSTVRIEPKREASHVPESYYLVVTIYNEGEFAAKQLKGECKLFSPINDIEEHILPIGRDFLGATPYELEPCRLVGSKVINAMRGHYGISLNVDIEFQYFGLADDKPLQYTAKYEHYKNTQLKKIA